MSPGTDIGEHEGPPPKVEFDGRGLGYMFSVGSMIIMLLSLDDIEQRASIIAEVCKEMKIPIQDVVNEDKYRDEMCLNCGLATIHHVRELGTEKCPHPDRSQP